VCGIFAIVALKAHVPLDVLERATQSLAHRGPDDSGTIVLHDSAPALVEIGLGSRRLAILDLSPLAHQPMHDPGNGNWIVYNGEIYNFRDVRGELERDGTKFLSNSDTEVLLKAYARWGEQCLLKFRGMFAFALWDARQHRLFLARDPMGIKPLYFTRAGPYFLIASEVRTLLGTGLVPRRIDRAGLLTYLTFGSAYDPLTLVEGIRSLPPGHSLTWEAGVIHESRYWDLVDQPVADEPVDAASTMLPEDGRHAGTQLQPILEEAVRLQLVSDVPIGVFLSGGIDSSALVSILRRGGLTPSTFSIVFREADYSEAEYSREIAHHFRTDHHEITVSQPDALSAVPDALQAMDLPTIDALNTYFVSRQARAAGVKVALSGLGGDEVFCGYSNFRSVPRMERFAAFWKAFPSTARMPFASAFALLPAGDRNRKLSSFVRDNGSVLHPYFLARMLFTPGQRDRLCLSTGESSAALALAPQRATLERALHLDPINRVSYLESRCYMLSTLLRDGDFMSMSHGLEVRVPLIDHQLAKTVLGFPGAWKLNRKTPKKLLIDALQGSLPNTVVHRSKQGFTLPFDHWLRAEFRSEVEPVLRTKIGRGPLGELLDRNEATRIWEDFLRRATSWSRPWSLYVLHHWIETYSLSA
jgi:asparagine synthase (glutamine-hydrolysing)